MFETEERMLAAVRDQAPALVEMVGAAVTKLRIAREAVLAAETDRQRAVADCWAVFNKKAVDARVEIDVAMGWKRLPDGARLAIRLNDAFAQVRRFLVDRGRVVTDTVTVRFEDGVAKGKRAGEPPVVAPAILAAVLAGGKS